MANKKLTTSIYVLKDPENNHIRYVGKSNNPYERTFGRNHVWKSHIEDAENKENKTYKANWIRGLLRKDLYPEIEVIDEVLKNQWQFWEKHYIKTISEYEKSFGYDLTNATDGGEGFNCRHTKESKAKIKIAMTGRVISWSNKIVETRRKNKSYIVSEETKKKQSISASKRKDSEETRKKKSEARLKYLKDHPEKKYWGRNN